VNQKLGDTHFVVVASVEGLQYGAKDVCTVVEHIANVLCENARLQGDNTPFEILDDIPSDYADNQLSELLTRWSRHLYKNSNKRLVVLFDEFDTLYGAPLSFVLGELRRYFSDRPKGFPASIGLCAMRKLRNYEPPSRSSPFNVVAESMETQPFSKDHVKSLYQQHTDETGQVFSSDSIDRVMYWTNGQPWLVNRFGKELCFEMEQGLDRSHVIDSEMVEEAAHHLARSQESHLDSLSTLLLEEEILDVIIPMTVTGSFSGPAANHQYVEDLGMIKRRQDGRGYEIANRLYAEVFPRSLTSDPHIQERLDQIDIGLREQ